MKPTGILVAACCVAAATAVAGGVADVRAASAEPVLAPRTDGVELGAISIVSVKYYKDKCLVCHGVTGEGDGEGSKELDPKPRSFRDPEWQQSTTDDKIRQATVDGGPAVGLSEGMPAHPDLKAQAPVLDGLVALIRAFGRQ